MKLMDANNGGAQVSGVDVVAGTVSRIECQSLR